MLACSGIETEICRDLVPGSWLSTMRDFQVIEVHRWYLRHRL